MTPEDIEPLPKRQGPALNPIDSAGPFCFVSYLATLVASSNFTESNFDTPSCPIVTP
jgi:hypothetical protein